MRDEPARGRVRVALLHNIVTPHALPLFERLAAQPDTSLKVYFLAETDRNRRWETSIKHKFAYEVLPNWAIRIGRADLYTFFVNPTLPAKLLRDGFDTVIADGWDSFASLAAFALCKALGRPFILWSGSTVNEPSWRRTMSLPLVRLIVRGSDGWIAYGTRAKEYLVKLGADPQRIAVAYNTVDIEWFQSRVDELRPHRDAIRADMGLGRGPVVLYVGQLIERKGALDLLGAYEMLLRSRPDAQLMLVGYGPLEAVLRKRAADRKLTGVIFAGHVPIPELPRFYVAADCFTLPSHEEVWGLVLNEAAACGLPLVSTQTVGATVDLIEDGVSGRVVPPGKPDQLSRALNEALEHRADWGQASRSKVGQLNFDQNVASMRAAIRGSVRNRPLPRVDFNPSYVAARDEIARLVPRHAVNILDVGCATGELGGLLRARNPGARLVGIEINPEMAAVAREKLNHVVVGDVADFELIRSRLGGETFDAVICADVLEHLTDPWTALRQLASSLTSSGTLILSLPNVGHFDTLVNIVVRKRWPYRERGIHDATHLRFFALENVRALVSQAGLRIERLERVYRVVESGSPLDVFGRLIALIPPLRELVTFQFILVLRTGPAQKRQARDSTMPSLTPAP